MSFAVRDEVDWLQDKDGNLLPAGDGQPYRVRGKYERDEVGKLIEDPHGAPFRQWRPPLDPELKSLPLGEAELLRDGEDLAILAFGHVVHPALEAAERLGAEGLSAAVLNARFAKPLDADRIASLAARCRRVLTVEEGTGLGGFGAAVMEVLAERGVGAAIHSVAIPDQIVEHGSPDQIRAAFGLDAAGIAAAARQLAQRS